MLLIAGCGINNYNTCWKYAVSKCEAVDGRDYKGCVDQATNNCMTGPEVE